MKKIMKKFEQGQMVKSIITDQVYRVINIDDNIYEVEHGIDGDVSFGCDDDFSPLLWSDPVYATWVTDKIKYTQKLREGFMKRIRKTLNKNYI